MIKPLYWMFKTENFREHVFYLIFRILFFLILTFILLICSNTINDTLISQISYLFAIISLLMPTLMLQGYFWELTERIINRETDITASNIYAKHSIKEIETIELPELGTAKFVWRGIASIVASLMLLYPLILFVIFTFFTSGESFKLLMFDNTQIIMTYIGLYCFIGLFVPALMWNYANRNSVFAVWNLPKAIHIMGTYPFRYLFKVIQFLLFAAILYYINIIIASAFGITSSHSIGKDFLQNSIALIYCGITFILNIYSIFVNAYILGTLAPKEEA